MESYKISIIVPVYNVENYITRCVKSLTGQKWSNLEILLVNDGSKDKSGEICDQLAAQDERIRVIHKENGGLISAWKRGVEEATGSYISFLDSDDWVDLNMLEEMGAFLTGSDKEIISSDYVIERENGTQEFVWQALAPGEYTKEQLKKEAKPNLLGHEQRFVHMSRCMKLISIELIRKNMHYCDPAIRMGEDATIMLPALLDCERLVIMNHKAYYHYMYVDSSMTHKYDKGLYLNIQQLYRILTQILQDRFVGRQLAFMKEQAKKEYVFLLFLVLKNEARGNPKGYRKNIAAIGKDPAVKKLIKETPVTVSQMSNRLIYLVLKYPSICTILMLRLAMIVFYARKS